MNEICAFCTCRPQWNSARALGRFFVVTGRMFMVVHRFCRGALRPDVTPLMIAAQTNALMELIINLITVTPSTYKMLRSLECRPTSGYRIASSRR